MTKIVLVHVISNLGIGGAETVLYQLLRSLSQDEFDHKVIYFHGGPFVARIKALGIPVYQVKGFFSPYDPLFCIRFFRLLRSLRPDCIHSTLWAANLLSRIAAWYYAFPLVQVLHNNQDQNGTLRNLIDRLAPRSVGAVVAVSKGVRDSAYEYAPWFTMRRMQVIQNGIDAQAFQAKAKAEGMLRKDLNIADDAFVIGTVGRFELVKNYSLLLTAFAVLRDKHRSERLVVVGQGSQEKILRKRAYDLGIEREVLFITGQPAYRYYTVFDCFVMTSYKEGLSMALLEAMSVGLPCIIASDQQEHDVIIDGYNGLLISGGQPQLLANTIDHLIQEPELRAKLGNVAQSTVERSFGVDEMIGEYASLYKKVSRFRLPHSSL